MSRRSSLGCIAFGSVDAPSPSIVRKGGDESVAHARDRRDESRVPIVILELDPEAPDMPVDDVALGDEVGAPDAVEDLVACQYASAAAGEEIEKALLDAAEVDQGGPGAYLAMDDIDLDLADRDLRNDRSISPRRSAGDDDAPREELLR